MKKMHSESNFPQTGCAVPLNFAWTWVVQWIYMSRRKLAHLWLPLFSTREFVVALQMSTFFTTAHCKHLHLWQKSQKVEQNGEWCWNLNKFQLRKLVIALFSYNLGISYIFIWYMQNWTKREQKEWNEPLH